jgi:hypothetical protein
VTRIKVWDVEIEQLAAAAPTVTELQPASWDAVELTIAVISARQLVELAYRSTDILPAPEPAPALPASVEVKASSVTMAGGHVPSTTPPATESDS